MNNKTIAIVGSRSIPCSTAFEILKREISDKVNERAFLRIVTGDARGVDEAARHLARFHDWDLQVYPALWETHGKGAGMIRNTDIVNACDELFAIWDGQSRGTLDSITKAVKAGKRVTIVNS